jgi:hypothetical protein
MREIAETSLVGDRTNGSLRERWIAQHTMRTRQTLILQKPLERRSVALEQNLHMSGSKRRAALRRRRAIVRDGSSSSGFPF